MKRKTTTVTPARNKVAAALAFVSGILFILSGYSVNLGIYRAIESGLQQYSAPEIWEFAVIPVNILGLIAQLGGIAVLVGAILFFKNHISTGKLLVMIGTGQGVITMVAGVAIELLQGGILSANNYVLWLATSAVGLGIIFSIVARSVAKPMPSNIRG
jgi:hypothetical protein